MSERKSCISLQLAHPGCFYHNSREIAPLYLVRSPEVNDCDRKAKEAYAYAEELYREASTNYMKRTKQRLKIKQEKLLWEAVIVLNSTHTLKDVQKLAKYLEKKYQWQATQIVVHHDEGYKDKRGITRYNYHAHIVFFMLNKSGIYVFKKSNFGKKSMAILQTEVAKILKMPRGESKQTSKRERLSAKQYRQVEKEKDNMMEKLKDVSVDAELFEKYAREEHQAKKRLEIENEALKSDLEELKKELFEYKKKEKQKQAEDEEGYIPSLLT